MDAAAVDLLRAGALLADPDPATNERERGGISSLSRVGMLTTTYKQAPSKTFQFGFHHEPWSGDTYIQILTNL